MALPVARFQDHSANLPNRDFTSDTLGAPIAFDPPYVGGIKSDLPFARSKNVPKAADCGNSADDGKSTEERKGDVGYPGRV